MSRYIHNQQATNNAFENLDFSDVGTIKTIIWSETFSNTDAYPTPESLVPGFF